MMVMRLKLQIGSVLEQSRMLLKNLLLGVG